MPEGDTIHYAARRIRPLVEGLVPRDRAPEPAAARRALARQARRPRGRGSVDAHGKHLFIRFDGGLDHPLAPAHDRLLGYVLRRAALAPGGQPRMARAEHRGTARSCSSTARCSSCSPTRAPASIAGSPGSGPTSSRPSSTSSAPPAPAARGRSDPARSARRCSTSARSPASATCGSARAASPRAFDPWRQTGKRHRRRGARDRAREVRPRMAAVGARRQPGRASRRLRERRAPVPALRRADPKPRPGRRQPHHVLVRRVPDVRRVGHKGADLIAPGNTFVELRGGPGGRRRRDRVRRHLPSTATAAASCCSPTTTRSRKRAPRTPSMRASRTSRTRVPRRRLHRRPQGAAGTRTASPPTRRHELARAASSRRWRSRR